MSSYGRKRHVQDEDQDDIYERKLKRSAAKRAKLNLVPIQMGDEGYLAHFSGDEEEFLFKKGRILRVFEPKNSIRKVIVEMIYTLKYVWKEFPAYDWERVQEKDKNFGLFNETCGYFDVDEKMAENPVLFQGLGNEMINVIAKSADSCVSKKIEKEQAKQLFRLFYDKFNNE